MDNPRARYPQVTSLLWRDKWLIGLSLISLVIVRIGLTAIGYKRLRRFLNSGVGHNQLHPALMRRVASSIAIASHVVPKATCLVRAMAAQWMLSMRGHRTEIQIGVRNGADQNLEAHAWLLSGKEIILGGSEDDLAIYIPLMKLE
jgi:Transglutaminase-like superfamily